MLNWRNTTAIVAMTAVAAGARAQSTPTMPTAPTSPVQVPIVSPSGTLGAVNEPVVNRPRLEKPSQAGSTELTWLGHAAWVLRSPLGTTVLIDPWLANPKAPQDFVMPATVDAILVTHAHADHLGQAVELSKKLHAPIIASFELIEHLGMFGITNGIGTNPGGTTKVKDLDIHAVMAVHSSSIEMAHHHEHDHEHEHASGCACHKDAQASAALEASVDAAVQKALDKKLPGKKGKLARAKAEKEAAQAAAAPPPVCTCPPHHDMPPHSMFAYAGAALGFVIEMQNGPTVYDAGDTDVFADMVLIRKRYAPEIALLPIGGTYGMDPKGAALATKMLGVKEVLPMHYGTMPQLAGTPQGLRDAIGEFKDKKKDKARVIAPNPGERVAFLP